MGVMTSHLTVRGTVTRTKILAMATAVIHQHGVAGFTIDQVCEGASVSKSQLYHFFPSREALIQAVADATVTDVLSLQAELFAGLTSLEGFRLWAAALVELQSERGGEGGCPIGSLHAQLDATQTVAQEILRGGFEQWGEAMHRGLEVMKANGELPPSCDVGEQTRLLLVALQGGLLLTDAYRDPTWLSEALEERLRVLASLASG